MPKLILDIQPESEPIDTPLLANRGGIESGTVSGVSETTTFVPTHNNNELIQSMFPSSRTNLTQV